MEGENIRFEFRIIAPEKAKYDRENSVYLKLNRKPNKIKLNRMINDMRSGNWTVSGETVQYDEMGNLAEGFTRYLACEMAGVPFPTWVATGVPRNSLANLNSGTSRPNHISANMIGIPCKREHMKIVNCMVAGYNQVPLTLSNHQMNQTLMEYKNVLDCIVGFRTLPGMGYPGKAAIARASANDKDNILPNFCEMYRNKSSRSGVIGSVVEALSKTLIYDSGSYHGFLKPKVRLLKKQDEYRKVEFALLAAMAGRRVKRILPVDAEAFRMSFENNEGDIS